MHLDLTQCTGTYVEVSLVRGIPEGIPALVIDDPKLGYLVGHRIIRGVRGLATTSYVSSTMSGSAINQINNENNQESRPNRRGCMVSDSHSPRPQSTKNAGTNRWVVGPKGTQTKIVKRRDTSC